MRNSLAMRFWLEFSCDTVINTKPEGYGQLLLPWVAGSVSDSVSLSGCLTLPRVELMLAVAGHKRPQCLHRDFCSEGWFNKKLGRVTGASMT